MKVKNKPGTWKPKMKASTLYASYLYYCKENNVPSSDIKTINELSDYLTKDLGFTKKRSNGVIYNLGTLEEAKAKFKAFEGV